jgi:hypothetical protein
MHKPVRPRTQTNTGQSTATLFLLAATFLPLAFSDDILEVVTENRFAPPFLLLMTDFAILFAIGLVSWLVRRPQSGWAMLMRWLVGVLITLGLDFFVDWNGLSSPAVEIVVAGGYTFALVFVLAAVVDASPVLLLRPGLRASRLDEWRRIRGGLPLLAGIFAAYLAGVYWDYLLNQNVIRTLTEAMDQPLSGSEVSPADWSSGPLPRRALRTPFNWMYSFDQGAPARSTKNTSRRSAR